MGNFYLLTISYVVVIFGLNTNICAEDIQGRLLTPEEGCGIAKVGNTKIVGGSPAKPGAFPWMALVGIPLSYNRSRFHCDGTLITSRHVLTAAHCIRRNMIVRLGAHDISDVNDGSQDYKVAHGLTHPRFKLVMRLNDIAILYLEDDVPFNDRIQPICLPLNETLQNKSFVDSNPFVAGWGVVNNRGDFSDVLMQLQIPVIENAQCKDLFKKEGGLISDAQFSEAVLCAGNLAGGQGAYLGDSGGPLMLPIQDNDKFPMYQIGVISYGLTYTRPGGPGVYSRVTHFMDWIQENIKQK